MADMNKLVHFAQRGGKNHNVGRFGGDVTVGTEGNPYRRRHKCRSVINSVPDEQGARPLGLCLHDCDLLLRALSCIHFSDADFLRQIADLRLSVSGDQQNSVDLMTGVQMVDEGLRILTRRIVEAKSSGITIVYENEALQA